VKLEIKIPSVKISRDRKQTKAVMRSAASEVASGIRSLLRSSQGSGRKYGKHTASAPGEAPAKRTGTLAGSIRTRVRQRDNTITASIRDQQFYALFLEKGAKGGGGPKRNRNRRGGSSSQRILEPRPFMQRVLDAKATSITRRIRDAILQDTKFVRQK
jgi:hypothetical protein